MVASAALADQHKGAIEFGIERWHAWAPGVETTADWRGWLEHGVARDTTTRPDVRFLPPMLRRRLDRLGRMALHTVWQCAQGLDEFDYVFGSRHGSLGRMADSLLALVNNEPLSPTTFSLSVHNAVAGLLSIARDNRSRATAMAAGLDTLALALVEGAMLLAEGTRNVVVTYVEDSVPDVYEPLIPTPRAHPYAVSLLLTRQATMQCAVMPVSAPNELGGAPEVELMRFMLDKPSSVVLGVNQHWQLERIRG